MAYIYRTPAPPPQQTLANCSCSQPPQAAMGDPMGDLGRWGFFRAMGGFLRNMFWPNRARVIW